MPCTCTDHFHDHTPAAAAFNAGRRRFIRLAALGAGASLFLGKAPAAFAGQAEALLLSCMDYRLADELARYMDTRGLTNRYDHVILAGASAGVMHDKFKDWHGTFWGHLAAAIELHKVHRVIVIDHRDCGAYKMAFGAEHAADPDVELAVHGAVLGKLAQQIKEKHPNMAVETHLMALDGSVTTISGSGTVACAAPAKSAALEPAGAETHTP
jgi:hypothetical protein